MINIRALLGDIGVPFWTVGKNVSEGWTTITCPMGCGDRSNHGGFSKDGTGYNCFKCGKHSITRVIATVGDLSWKNAKSLIDQYSDILVVNTVYHEDRASKVEWPPRIIAPDLPSLHAQYLHERGYNPQQIRDAYGVHAQYQVGDFKYRLLIPCLP